MDRRKYKWGGEFLVCLNFAIKVTKVSQLPSLSASLVVQMPQGFQFAFQEN